MQQDTADRHHVTSRGGAALALLALGLAVVGAALAPAAAQEPERVERVTAAINGWENNLTPYGITFQSGAFHEMINLVHDTLYWSHYTEEPEPWLAESAEPNEDHTVWTVQLREGVTWHDGEDLTADDVAFSYEYQFDNPSARYSHHITVLPEYAGAEVLDEHTVELRFEEPVPRFPLVPAADIPILPEHVWGDIDQPRDAVDELPVGSGPYELVEMESDERYVLEANDDYFKGTPLVQQLVLPIVRDSSAAFSALRTGEIDALVRGVPPELIEDLEDEPEVEVLNIQTYEGHQLYFHAQQEPTSDAAFRRAIGLAVDRQALVDRVLQGHGQPGRDEFMHPDSYLAKPDGTSEFDPDAAATQLDEAGYEAGDDGVRQTPDGQPIELALLVNSFDPVQVRTAELVSENLAEIGLETEVEGVDPGTLSDRRDSGEFDLWIDSLNNHMHMDPDAFYHFFGPGITGLSFGGYDNPDFNELMERAAVTADWDERLELIHEQQDFFAEELPAVMLFYPDEYQAYRPAAYDGWFADPGHLLLTKRAFLPEYAASTSDEDGAEASEAAEPGDDDAEAADAAATGDEAGGLPWSVLVAAVAVVAVIGVVIGRRRTREEDE